MTLINGTCSDVLSRDSQSQICDVVLTLGPNRSSPIVTPIVASELDHAVFDECLLVLRNKCNSGDRPHSAQHVQYTHHDNQIWQHLRGSRLLTTAGCCSAPEIALLLMTFVGEDGLFAFGRHARRGASCAHSEHLSVEALAIGGHGLSAQALPSATGVAIAAAVAAAAPALARLRHRTLVRHTTSMTEKSTYRERFSISDAHQDRGSILVSSSPACHSPAAALLQRHGGSCGCSP